MRIDPKSVWTEVDLLAHAPGPDPNQAMARVIKVCAASFPHPDWKRMGELDYTRGVEELMHWLPMVFRSEPPQVRVSGLWFGLFNPIDEHGRAMADIYVFGSGRYDRHDHKLEWIFGCEYKPAAGEAHSSVLRSIYEIAYASEGGLGNDAEWSLALAFGVVAVRAAVAAIDVASIPELAEEVGIAVGFDSGDLLRIGELTRKGLVSIPTE